MQTDLTALARRLVCDLANDAYTADDLGTETLAVRLFGYAKELAAAVDDTLPPRAEEALTERFGTLAERDPRQRL